MVAQRATATFVRCVDHSELLDEPSSLANVWKASEVSSTSAMRPSANVKVDTTSMNRRGAERSTPLLLLLFFFGGVGDSFQHHSFERLEWDCLQENVERRAINDDVGS